MHFTFGGIVYTPTHPHHFHTQVSHLFINHPEPPQQRASTEKEGKPSEFDSEGSHLLTGAFFLHMHRVLGNEGLVTIVTDNLWYGQMLLRTVAALTAPLRRKDEDATGAEKHVSVFKCAEVVCGRGNSEVESTKPFVQESVGAFHLYGNPGPACGHHAQGASSYFDRLWKKEQQTTRYFLHLVKVSPDHPIAYPAVPVSARQEDAGLLAAKKKRKATYKTSNKKKKRK
jgi:hypothetical protein